MSVKPIFYYLPLFQGGPPDQTGVLSGKMHLIRFGDTYTGRPGEFNGRVVVYSHGLRESKKIRFGKEKEQKVHGELFYKKHFLSGLFSKNEAAFAALETVELAVCHSGIADPASVLDGFSRNLPKGVVARGPIGGSRFIFPECG